MANGLSDELRRQQLAVFGPSQAAARLESSKVFAKEFMERHGIPTASLCGIHDSPAAAYSALCDVDWPVVIKADSLCAGKGVSVAPTPDDATAFIERVMDNREFGEAGGKVVLEPGGNEVQFINLPADARIRIYTLAGDLVRDLRHSDPARDFERWDLKNGHGEDVVSGIYVYRVESGVFTQQSRFVVIR